MSGKHIKRNVEIKGASVLDITPTILELSGIPIGKDMDGKVLSEAIRRIIWFQTLLRILIHTKI